MRSDADSRPPRPGDPLATAAQMRAVDRAAIEEWGISGAVLMETAGRACAARLERLATDGACAREALVLCGPGNNGGDGFVIARTLAAWGWRATVWFAGVLEPRTRFSEETRTNLALCERLGLAPQVLGGDEAELVRFATAAEAAARSGGVAVDAVFGTGLARAVAGVQREALRRLAASHASVLAVDVPSGLDADTGESLGAVRPARWTTTLAALKPGLLTPTGRELAGEVELAEIGIPRPLLDALPRAPMR
ncbi:MAG: NAD(P)H-hydrate epimerase [Planctomycetota bacterium]